MNLKDSSSRRYAYILAISSSWSIKSKAFERLAFKILLKFPLSKTYGILLLIISSNVAHCIVLENYIEYWIILLQNMHSYGRRFILETFGRTLTGR